jgi:hypothetical protein
MGTDTKAGVSSGIWIQTITLMLSSAYVHAEGVFLHQTPKRQFWLFETNPHLPKELMAQQRTSLYI